MRPGAEWTVWSRECAWWSPESGVGSVALTAACCWLDGAGSGVMWRNSDGGCLRSARVATTTAMHSLEQWRQMLMVS